MKWFKPREIIRVVEVKDATPLPEMTSELAQQIATLQYHPGFAYILKKLQLQQGLLATKLQRERQSEIDSEFLKSGIAWTGWLQDQLTSATGYQSRQGPARESVEQELEAFEQLRAHLQIVGQ